jgi:hypothetical protein
MPEECDIKLQSRFQLMTHARGYSVGVGETNGASVGRDGT